MPKLWSDTIESHRHDVRESILDAVETVVGQGGLIGATMTRIATEAGVGRATLYKYFPDVQATLGAWHERQVAVHLAQLTAITEATKDPGEAFERAIAGYARIVYFRSQHGAEDLHALLHRGPSVLAAENHLLGLFQRLLEAGKAAGQTRADIPADQLATYCLHALSAAGDMPSEDAALRLAKLTLATLRSAPAETRVD